jgi:hypothetical protein
MYHSCASVKRNHVVIELHSEEILVELTFPFHLVENSCRKARELMKNPPGDGGEQ